jgi:hypothetical protein
MGFSAASVESIVRSKHVNGMGSPTPSKIRHKTREPTQNKSRHQTDVDEKASKERRSRQESWLVVVVLKQKNKKNETRKRSKQSQDRRESRRRRTRRAGRKSCFHIS